MAGLPHLKKNEKFPLICQSRKSPNQLTINYISNRKSLTEDELERLILEVNILFFNSIYEFKYISIKFILSNSLKLSKMQMIYFLSTWFKISFVIWKLCRNHEENTYNI